MEIHIKIVFSMSRLDSHFIKIHILIIFTMQTGLLRKKMHISPDFKNKTDDHLNFTLPPTFSFFLEKKKDGKWASKQG